MIELFGAQVRVQSELESRIVPFIKKPLESGSDGCVVFDNPGESGPRYGGGEADAICAVLSEKLGVPVVRIPPFVRSEEVLESVKSQLLAVAKLRKDDELLEELEKFSSRGAIVSSGLLVTRCMHRSNLKALVYIGPLELYSGKEYQIQDLILHFLDHSQGVFFVLSVSEENWRGFPRDVSTWQKIYDRMRYKVLVACIDPITEYESFVKYAEHLVGVDQLDLSVLERTRELWKDADDRTHNGLKMLLGRC